MRIAKNGNGQIIIDGEGQVIDTGITVECENISIVNSFQKPYNFLFSNAS